MGDIIEASILLKAPIIKLYKDYSIDQEYVWKSVEGASDRVTALLDDRWDDHDLDNTKQARNQSNSPHRNKPPEVLAIPLTAPEPGEKDGVGCNALIVTMKSPGVYRRAGIGTLGLWEEFLDKGIKIQIETLHEGERSSDERYREFSQVVGKKKQRQEQWEGRFIHEMSRLERQIFKLV